MGKNQAEEDTEEENEQAEEKRVTCRPRGGVGGEEPGGLGASG